MKSVLIANRGEIACRIAQACRGLGLRSIAVFSDADADGLHVALADAAVRIGPAPARASYLDADAVIEAARASGAQAIHPGYGFLSENAGFARKVREAGLVFVGPAAEIIAEMGDKGRARARAQGAQVPVLPGSGRLPESEDADLVARALEVGLPLLVKATGGGGGIGMRRLDAASDVPGAVARVREQALRSFGDAGVYLEHFVAAARHVEVQVFGTGPGRVVAFPERDCSVQRRFQKVVEESPAAGLPPGLSDALRAAAARLAAQVGYLGAGTVEFIVDARSGRFYFLEMNTRIQVEHPVTEMVTGLDLVALQLRLAAGEDLSAAVPDAPRAQGHAIEARLYAEVPARGFLPSPGRLTQLALPKPEPHLRVDAGVRAGDHITPFYDPMIAKVIAWGADRARARARLADALARTCVDGVGCNLDFLRAVLDHGEFRAGAATTDFVARCGPELVGAGAPARAGAEA
ncbi:biotin carboxylase N-terminal domain-containing protein [Xanthobacter sp. KR7-225]|uniref:acetyl-CoA carboxylase biotin carboxylase subunit n=1 Tax=Xanthobacter sp. KR7-225 TaxID=3156613 RepID=UPI0032B52778